MNTETDRQAGRQAGRQETERERDMQTGRQAHSRETRLTCMHIYIYIWYIYIYIYIYRYVDINTYEYEIHRYIPVDRYVCTYIRTCVIHIGVHVYACFHVEKANSRTACVGDQEARASWGNGVTWAIEQNLPVG